MPDAQPLSGRCLCGAVRFTAQPKHDAMDVCHCESCRRWSGGAWMTVECEPDMPVEDDGALGIYGSSGHAERGFCKICGTSLFWRMRDGSLLTVAAQAFDDPARFRFASEIFIDHKPPNYGFANPTQKKTSAEIYAEFPDIAG